MEDSQLRVDAQIKSVGKKRALIGRLFKSTLPKEKQRTCLRSSRHILKHRATNWGETYKMKKRQSVPTSSKLTFTAGRGHRQKWTNHKVT